MKQQLKKRLPKWVHHWINRTISRRRIAAKLGDWFELEWKSEAQSADAKRWREVYDRSWEAWSQPDLSQQDCERIFERIQQPGNLIDIGCGDGFLLEYLLTRGISGSGIDLSHTALRRARTRIPNAVLSQSVAEHLPFCDQAFDIVVSAHTLEHVQNFDRAVQELIRITRQQLIILIPCQERLQYTEDYHLHFFPDPMSLMSRIGIANARCERYSVPPGICAYQGDVLLWSYQK